MIAHKCDSCGDKLGYLFNIPYNILDTKTWPVIEYGKCKTCEEIRKFELIVTLTAIEKKDENQKS